MPIKVAIVEDDDRVRERMSALVEGSGDLNVVMSCASGEEALRQIAVVSPDVVLMDINLPRQSGIDCTWQLKRDLPQTQVIMLTVYDDEERVFQALMAGATGYLLKRTPPSEILDAIRDVHTGGSPMSSTIARMVVAHFGVRRAPSAERDTPSLSPREQEILEHLMQGYRYKEVADRLACSIHTVREHLRRIYQKLHVSNAREAIGKYLGGVRPE